jgi:tetratricopeptide (TPR) repeat protein
LTKQKTPKYDIFLSYSNQDYEAVEEIANCIADTGIHVWFDRWDMVPGGSSTQVNEALEFSATIAFLIGPAQSTSEQLAQLEDIKSAHRSNVIPILLPDAEENQIPDDFIGLDIINLSEQITDATELGRLIALILGARKPTEFEKEQYIGDALKQIGDIDGALAHFEKALKIAENLPDDNSALVSKTHGLMGSILRDHGKWDRALEHFKKAVAINETHPDSKPLTYADHLNSIGGIHYDKGEYKKAQEFFEKALLINQKADNKNQEAIALNNIGLVMKALGDRKRAREMYERSLEIAKSVGDKVQQATTLNNISIIHFLLGDFKKALEIIDIALPIAKEINNKRISVLLATRE